MWKPSPTQRQILGRYEKTCLELRYSRQETKKKLNRLAEAMRDTDFRVPTPREKQIRDAIYADKKAERAFRFFMAKGHPEWAQLVRLGEWVNSQGEHPSVRDANKELLVPGDRVLLALREAGDQGLSDVELQKVSPKNWFPALRSEGITFKRFKQGEGWRTVLGYEPRPRKLVKQSDVFRDIREKIESLGNPAPLQEACRHAGRMSRMLRFHEKHLKDSPLNNFPRVMEDDLLRVAGHHLKRMTYLMAVAERATKHLSRSTEELAQLHFQTLHRRRYPRRKK